MVEPGGLVTATTVCVPGSVDLDRRSLSTAAGDVRFGTIAVRAQLELDSSPVKNVSPYRTQGQFRVRRRSQLRQHTGPERRFAMANLLQGRAWGGVLCALISAATSRFAG